MTVTFNTAATCPTCGCRARGFVIHTIRVNARSVRTIGTGIGWWERRCVECRSPIGAPEQYRLTDEDQARVNTAMERVRERNRGRRAA